MIEINKSILQIEIESWKQFGYLNFIQSKKVSANNVANKLNQKSEVRTNEILTLILNKLSRNNMMK